MTPFDLPVAVDETADVARYGEALEPFSVGRYQLDSDRLVVGGDGQRSFLDALRSTYRERIRDIFRAQRRTVIVQLTSMNISSLSITGQNGSLSEIKTPGELVPVITLHGVGTGQLSLLIRLPKPFTDETLLALRNARNIRVHIDQTYFGFKYLQGWLSIEEVTHYLVLLAMFAGRKGSVSAKDIDLAREKAGNSTAALRAILDALPDRRHIYSGLETYPALAIRTGLGASELRDAVTKSNALLRGVITGDRNWATKSQQVVSRLIPMSDVSTRESILWFVDINGTAKIYSAELETDYWSSLGLLAFELDVLLTQRLVLLKSSYYLSSVERARGYVELLEIRESQLRLVNEFYNSTLAFKDTTAVRLQALRSTFRLDALEREADRLLSGLAESLRVFHDSRILQRQTLLTVVVAAFGGGTLGENLAAGIGSKAASTGMLWSYTVAGFLMCAFAGAVVAAALFRRRE